MGCCPRTVAGLSSVEVTEAVAAVEMQRVAWRLWIVRLIGEVEERRLAGDYARTSTADLLVSLLRVARGDARARVAPPSTSDRGEVSGATVRAAVPARRRRLGRGLDLGRAHRGAMRLCRARPRALAPSAAPVGERLLVETAGTANRR